MTKLLLYCTKGKPYLVRNESDKYWYTMQQFQSDTFKNVKTFNGKIVAECDYEVEEIYFKEQGGKAWYETATLTEKQLTEKSCLSETELFRYLYVERHLYEDRNGYAIQIKNLHIFDEPKELSSVCKYDNSYNNMFGWLEEDDEKYIPLTKAPQNMMWVYVKENGQWVKYLFISIRPQWLCKIANKEKDVEVRKVVLKGILKCLN